MVRSSAIDDPLIFIIDNDPTIAALLPAEFADLGHRSIAVRTPEEARSQYLRMFTASDYRSPIFLIDIAIDPNETGWDMVKFIRRYDKDALIFMFTGKRNMVVDKLQLKKYDANGMIYKPKDALEILAEIKKYQTKGHGFGDQADGQAGRWSFSDREMACLVFNIVFILALSWFVGHIDAKVNILVEEQSTEKAFRIADDGKIMELRGMMKGK